MPRAQFTALSELTPENEACVILSPGQYTALPADHFLKQKYPDLKSSEKRFGSHPGRFQNL